MKIPGKFKEKPQRSLKKIFRNRKRNIKKSIYLKDWGIRDNWVFCLKYKAIKLLLKCEGINKNSIF